MKSIIYPYIRIHMTYCKIKNDEFHQYTNKDDARTFHKRNTYKTGRHNTFCSSGPFFHYSSTSRNNHVFHKRYSLLAIVNKDQWSYEENNLILLRSVKACKFPFWDNVNTRSKENTYNIYLWDKYMPKVLNTRYQPQWCPTCLIYIWKFNDTTRSC